MGTPWEVRVQLDVAPDREMDVVAAMLATADVMQGLGVARLTGPVALLAMVPVEEAEES